MLLTIGQRTPAAITGLFKAGDFGKPALTDGQQVPGTMEATRLLDEVTYPYEQTPTGGR